MTHAVEQVTSSRRRSRAGCWTCRGPTVKKGCDQRRPVCGRCERLHLPCDYAPRPTLAERRKINRSTGLAGLLESNATSPIVRDASEISNSSPGPGSASKSSSSNSLIELATDANSFTLMDFSVEDCEAIHYFRTEFAKLHHTKNPEYSLISLMFKMGQTEPMVMHMIVAVGHQEMDFRRPQSSITAQQAASHHYGSALRLLADAVEPANNSAKNLDTILTALWLMLIYEQQFGDERCRAYLSHLQGVASLLQVQSGNLLQIPPHKLGAQGRDSIALRADRSSQDSKISIYAARVLIWIVLLDSAAATSGVGGHVNEAILTMLLSNPTDSQLRSRDPIKAVARLHHYSNSLYRLAWGDAYPQSELVDDVENRNVYALLGHCAYLRFLTAQLATLYLENPDSAVSQAQAVEYSIDEVGDLFRELMEVAHELSLETNNHHRLVANMRAIVPMYYAIILEFKRLTAFDGPLDERQRYASTLR